MKNNLTLLLAFSFIMSAFAQQPALLEPTDGCVYHGAQLSTYETGDPLAGYLGALNDTTINPVVRGFFMSIPGERGPDLPLLGLKNFLHAADSIGFIPELSLFLVGKVGTNIIATDSIIAVSNQYDWILDSVITLCKNYNRKMFLRIGGEFNGKGPGWNGGGYHPYLYVTMFQKIVNLFTTAGFRDSIATNWCYYPAAANDFDVVDGNGPRWYPGDAYVDWFGLDVFDITDFDQSLPDSTGRNITPKGKSERFLAMARAKGKPVFLSETSAKDVNISSDYNDGVNDWNFWFVKFWNFIDVHKEIKGFCYINANWPTNSTTNWGNSRIQDNSYVTAQYKLEMKNPKYIHLHGYGCSGISGINEFPRSNQKLNIYPNPTNSFVNLTMENSISGNYAIFLYNSLGEVLLVIPSTHFAEGQQPVQLNFSKYENGLYYLRIQGMQSTITGKLIINK